MRAATVAALCLAVQLPVGTPSVSAAPELDARIVVTFDGAAPGIATLDRAVEGPDIAVASVVSSTTRGYRLSGASSWSELYGAMDDLRGVAGVETVTFTPIVRAVGFDDPYIPDMWGLDNATGIKVDAAWSYADGRRADGTSVNVAVIDTGGTSHPDLDANVIPGYDFVSVDPFGLVDYPLDGDGWDPDPSDPGDWCPATETAPLVSSSWHGTHVAGTIAAVAGNDVGVAGIAPRSKVMHVRALGRCGAGFLDDVAAAMRWAAGLAVPGVPNNLNPVKVINMSLSGLGDCTTVSWDWFQAEVDEVVNAGTLVVVAAGNNNASANSRVPASCDNVVTVGASTAAGARASFSNYGSAVDIAAPGDVVLSTINLGETSPAQAGYAFMSGTSMATPHVAGVAALVWSQNPSLTVAQVTTALTTTTTALVSPDAAKPIGTGVVNASAAVGTSGTKIVPGAPTGVSATQLANGQVRVQWTAPASSGASAVTGYSVTGGSGCTTASTTCDVSGVTPGVATTFTVRAENARGLGATTSSNSVTVVLPPSAPRNVTVTQSQLTATLQWDAPLSTNGGAVTGYRVEGGTGVGCTSVVTRCTVTGLTPGTAYAFSVYADNSAGASPAATSSAITTPAGPPAPVNVGIAVGTSNMVVLWDEASGGLTATSFLVTVTPGNLQCRTTNLRCDFSGLQPSTGYTVTLRAEGPSGTVSDAVVQTGTTGAAPTVTTAASSSSTAAVATLKKGKRVRLTSLFKVPAGARLSWRTTGGCRVSGGYLVAPTKTTRCTVTMRATKSGKTTSTSRTVRVV